MDLTPPEIPPGFLTRWCEVLSQDSESPPGAFLPAGLALLSAIAGPRVIIRWGVAHEERLNLWILNVGLSALARKTSGLAGLKTAVRWCRSGGDDSMRLLPMSRISDAGLVSALDVVSEDTAKAQPEKFPGVETPEVGEVVRAVPVAWVTIFNEVSPVWMEDGPGWAMDAQRAMLQIYDGQLSSTTKATKVPAQDCFVTAVGNIPPGVLREKTTLGMLSSGFVGRWLVIPTPAPDRIVSFPAPNGSDPLNRVRGDVEHLRTMAMRQPRYEARKLWDPAALETRDHWYRDHKARIEAMDPNDPYAVADAELFSRLQATHLKLATLVGLSRTAELFDDLCDVQVNCDDVAWANVVVDNSIRYVTETLRDAGAEASSLWGRMEGRIIRWLESVGAVSEETARTMKEVTNATKGGGASRGDLSKAVDGLVSSGYLNTAPRGRGKCVWLSA